MAKFIKMKKEGYKIYVQPIQQDNLDSVYLKFKEMSLHAIQITPGSKDLDLTKALFDPTCHYDRNFSSKQVKNGGMYNYLQQYLLIYVL